MITSTIIIGITINVAFPFILLLILLPTSLLILLLILLLVAGQWLEASPWLWGASPLQPADGRDLSAKNTGNRSYNIVAITVVIVTILL